jgi:hypothetical protein
MEKVLDLKAIKQRAEAATPAPWWRTDPPWGQGTTVHAGPSDDPHKAHCYIADGDVPADEMIASEVVYNMTFIAAARQDVPDLLAYIQHLERELYRPHSFKERAADALGIALLDWIDRGLIATRTTVSDALESWADNRFHVVDGSGIRKLRELAATAKGYYSTATAENKPV